MKMFVVRNKKRYLPAFTPALKKTSPFKAGISWVRGFTLVEIIVSALILSGSFAVVLYTFTYARGYIRHAQRRIVAANLVRGVSNYLYKELSRDGVDSVSLSPADDDNPHNFPFAYDDDKFDIDGVSYTGVYSVAEDAELGYYQVTYDVTYPLEN